VGSRTGYSGEPDWPFSRFLENPVMSMVQDDIDHIEQIVRKLVMDLTRSRSLHDYDEFDQRERIIRVEEELKHQRELMREGFNRMDKRFEQVDKRFEQMQLEMNKRFEQVDKRFEQVDKRFEQVDKRFEQMTARIDRFMIWSFATTVSVGGVIIAVIKFT
jgi:predicted nuclease with TOPRIM domain